MTKACPACGYLCPPKALRCRGCDSWFPAPPVPDAHWLPGYLGAVLLLLALLLCVRFCAPGPPPAVAAPAVVRPMRGPPPAGATEWADRAGNVYTREPGGLWSLELDVACDVCNGKGYRVGVFTGSLKDCWRCQGTGVIFVGIEQLTNEPLRPVREDDG